MAGMLNGGGLKVDFEGEFGDTFEYIVFSTSLVRIRKNKWS